LPSFRGLLKKLSEFGTLFGVQCSGWAMNRTVRIRRGPARGCRGLAWASFLALACGDDDARPAGAEETGFLSVGEDSTGGDTDGPGGTGPKLDVGDNPNPTGPGGDCPGGGGGTPTDEYEFSVIWVANSPEGTVSKIDTQTAEELARYRTGPDSPDPSRTSVNLQGDVAVANRWGSVTKIAAEEERCVDKNGNGTIETSQGPDDVLPWGEDECVLWHHDVGFEAAGSGNQGGPRAIAWDGGDINACVAMPNVWVGWRDQPHDRAIVRRLDGQTGQVLGEAEIPDWQGNWGHGIYGGAADADGAFWGMGTLGTLVRVDPDTYDVQRWDNPTAHVIYGIALDAHGDPWLAGWGGHIWHFDRATGTFEDMGGTGGGPDRLRGLMIDQNGDAWIAGNNPCALVRFDTTTKTLVDGAIPLPGCGVPVGVSIDVDGMVWVVDQNASVAYKVDPSDNSTQVVEGLVNPYTYSDMTGAGLGLVVHPPPG
jgi:streptogramin lyase